MPREIPKKRTEKPKSDARSRVIEFARRRAGKKGEKDFLVVGSGWCTAASGGRREESLGGGHQIRGRNTYPGQRGKSRSIALSKEEICLGKNDRG